MALVVFAFFFAYYVYEPPYRGLYPDLLTEGVYGRSQGVQHVFRGVAIGGALIAGGALPCLGTVALPGRRDRAHARLRRPDRAPARGRGPWRVFEA